MLRAWMLGTASLLGFFACVEAASIDCKLCGAWNEDQAPFRIFGDTYYVGTRGLSAVLIVTSQGHVLIDGGLAESAAPIAGSIRALGFRVAIQVSFAGIGDVDLVVEDCVVIETDATKTHEACVLPLR